MACHVLARATLLWPPPPSRDAAYRAARATTREGRAFQQRQRLAEKRIARATQARKNRDSHAWVFAGGFARCGRCLRLQPPRGTDVEPCSGPPARVAAVLESARSGGHRMQVGALMAADGRGHPQPLYICIRCGAWASQAVQPQCLLWSRCERPTEAGKQALRRAARGVHPKDGRTPPLLVGLRPLLC